MIVLIDIILAIVVWNKGWKWWVLAPFAALFVVSIISGIIVEASGGSAGSEFFLTYVDCLYAIIGFVFLGMWYRGRG